MRQLFTISLAVGLIASACNLDEKEQPAPKIYLQNEGNYEIEINDTVTLSPKITYDYDSKYSWKINDTKVSDELDYTFVAKELSDFVLTFTVETSSGSDDRNINISVVRNIDFESFDNFTAPKSKTLVSHTDTTEGFACKGLLFANTEITDSVQLAKNFANWNGFAFSNLSAITNTVSTKAIGCAYDSRKTSNYLVANTKNSAAKVDFGGQKHTVKSIDVANDNLVYLISKYGYGVTDTTALLNYFGTDDRYTLIIKGLDETGNQISAVEYDLIDCRFQNPAKYIRVNEWQTIGLTALGRVSALSFEITSTQDKYPYLFCLDNIKLQN
ncbi:MAG: DUF4465 domain-containing protein [Bacteroidales bacterium]|nr:DUF4465 domain-containing protein [Bacteroidales bacterium]